MDGSSGAGVFLINGRARREFRVLKRRATAEPGVVFLSSDAGTTHKTSCTRPDQDRPDRDGDPNPSGDYPVQLEEGVTLEVGRNRFEEIEQRMEILG